MQVTDVRISLNSASNDRLRGFSSITFDGSFVVRDIKIIDGPNGLFVAMPSRKLMRPCPACRGKNHLLARFCNQCGTAIEEVRQPTAGRVKLHCDVAHPINAVCRNMIQEAVIRAFEQEVRRSAEPGYVPEQFEDAGEEFHPPE